MRTYDTETALDTDPIPYPRNRRAGANTERAAFLGLLALIAYVAVRGLFGALSKAFWYDEICTWAMAQQPSVAALWKALGHAADGNPPGLYLIERAVSQLVSNDLVAYRIPSILGFCCVVLCVFVFVRRRSGGMLALACAAIPLATTLYGFTAEARPYSLVVACISIALVCYQRAPAVWWMVLMASSLALAQSLHYYAMFAFVPFGAAEAALLLKTRRIRWGVWLVLASGLVPLAAFWPLLSRFGSVMGSHFWSKPSLEGILESYGEFLRLPTPLGVAAFATLALAVVIVWFKDWNREVLQPADQIPFHEYVLVLTLIGLPFVGFVVTRLAHGGMNSRYVLSAVLGIPLAAGCVLPRLERQILMVLAVFLGLSLALQEMSFWRSHPGKAGSPVDSVESLVNSTGRSDLPVVISAGILYLPIAHYASPEWRKRLFVIVDQQKAIAATGNDSIEAQLSILQEYLPLHVFDLSTFTPDHPAFLLYSHKAALRGDWWPSELAREHYAVELLAGDDAGRVYLVTSKND